MKVNQKVRSGNVARILIDGREVGLMQNVDFSDDYAPEPASGIGDIRAVEHVPTFARHGVTCSYLALRTRSLHELGIIPENGVAAMKGLVCDIEVYDKKSNELLRKYLSCTYASGSLTIQKHAIVAHNATFMALDVSGKM